MVARLLVVNVDLVWLLVELARPRSNPTSILGVALASSGWEIFEWVDVASRLDTKSVRVEDSVFLDYSDSEFRDKSYGIDHQAHDWIIVESCYESCSWMNCETHQVEGFQIVKYRMHGMGRGRAVGTGGPLLGGLIIRSSESARKGIVMEEPENLEDTLSLFGPGGSIENFHLYSCKTITVGEAKTRWA